MVVNENRSQPQYVSEPDLDLDGKLKISCTRCRQLKRKCNRAVPECSNCSKHAGTCIYKRRKSRIEEGSASEGLNGGIGQVAGQEGEVTPTAQAPTTSTTLGNVSDAPAPHIGEISSKPETTNSYQSVSRAEIVLSRVNFKVSANNDLNLSRVGRTLATSFVTAFFKHNHRAYPFIHQPEFLANFQTFSLENLHENEPNFTYEALMVMAIGCTSLERAKILPQNKLSEALFQKAISFKSGEMSSRGIQNVRNLLLLGLYSYYDPTEFSTWEITGKLVRQSIALGLHKSLSESKRASLTAQEIEMSYRTFWSVYVMDRMVSGSLGRPLGILDSDVSVPLPLPVFGDEENTSISRTVIKLRQIEGTILQKVHSVGAKTDIAESEIPKVIDKIRADIELWYASVKVLQAPKTKQFSFHLTFSWLSTRYNQLLVLLYSPSHLVPSPSAKSLDIVSRACQLFVSTTYNLFTLQLLPLNWITLYRFLTICMAMLNCLRNWMLDVEHCKNEICYCIEILDAFGHDWAIAKKCAAAFRTIDLKLVEISFGAITSKELQVDKLINEVLGKMSLYKTILGEVGYENWLCESEPELVRSG